MSGSTNPLSRGGRFGAGLLLASISLALGVAPAQAGPKGGHHDRGRHTGWARPARVTRVVTPYYASRSRHAHAPAVVYRRVPYGARPVPIYTRFGSGPPYVGAPRSYGGYPAFGSYPRPYTPYGYRGRHSAGREVATVAGGAGAGALVGGLLGARRARSSARSWGQPGLPRSRTGRGPDTAPTLIARISHHV